MQRLYNVVAIQTKILRFYCSTPTGSYVYSLSIFINMRPRWGRTLSSCNSISNFVFRISNLDIAVQRLYNFDILQKKYFVFIVRPQRGRMFIA